MTSGHHSSGPRRESGSRHRKSGGKIGDKGADKGGERSPDKSAKDADHGKIAYKAGAGANRQPPSVERQHRRTSSGSRAGSRRRSTRRHGASPIAMAALEILFFLILVFVFFWIWSSYT